MPEILEREPSPETSWQAYDVITDVLAENEVMNGDLIFVIGILLGELVKNDGFDFDELFDDIKEVALKSIKVMSDA